MATKTLDFRKSGRACGIQKGCSIQSIGSVSSSTHRLDNRERWSEVCSVHNFRWNNHRPIVDSSVL